MELWGKVGGLLFGPLCILVNKEVSPLWQSWKWISEFGSGRVVSGQVGYGSVVGWVWWLWSDHIGSGRVRSQVRTLDPVSILPLRRCVWDTPAAVPLQKLASVLNSGLPSWESVTGN